MSLSRDLLRSENDTFRLLSVTFTFNISEDARQPGTWPNLRFDVHGQGLDIGLGVPCEDITTQTRE
jgi:hypothetical protein